MTEHSLGYINTVVDSMYIAIEYYKKLLDAISIQILPRFQNIDFTQSAGFMQNTKYNFRIDGIS